MKLVLCIGAGPSIPEMLTRAQDQFLSVATIELELLKVVLQPETSSNLRSYQACRTIVLASNLIEISYGQLRIQECLFDWLKLLKTTCQKILCFHNAEVQLNKVVNLRWGLVLLIHGIGKECGEMIKINHLGFSFFSNMSRRTQDAEKAAVIKSIMSNTKPKPWEYTDSISAAVDCNEVYDNLFVGDKNAAKNKRYLKKIGITHVVNAAEGHSFGMVNTDADFYKDINIKYLGLCLMDLSVTNVAIHFEEVADFIDKALLKGGRVLVHCVMGLSRSAIFSLAFLVMKRGMSACSAMAFIRRRRDINPNDGFIYQLAALDNKIGRKQTYYI